MQSVFVCSVVLLLLLLMLPVLLCSCTLFLHLLFHCNNSSTAHFLPSLTRSNPPHTRALSRERAREKRQSNESETPTTHCWTIIPAIQVSSRFSSILLVYVFILLYLFVGYCRQRVSSKFSSILQLYVSMYPGIFAGHCHPNFIKFHPYFHPSFLFMSSFYSIFLWDIAFREFHPNFHPSFSYMSQCTRILLQDIAIQKFHQISSIFCLRLKFTLILLQDIANQVSSKNSSIFFLV
jgi:hypothetical protein